MINNCQNILTKKILEIIRQSLKNYSKDGSTKRVNPYFSEKENTTKERNNERKNNVKINRNENSFVFSRWERWGRPVHMCESCRKLAGRRLVRLDRVFKRTWIYSARLLDYFLVWRVEFACYTWFFVFKEKGKKCDKCFDAVTQSLHGNIFFVLMDLLRWTRNIFWIIKDYVFFWDLQNFKKRY